MKDIKQIRKEKSNIFLWIFFFFNIGKLLIIFFILNLYVKNTIEVYSITFALYVLYCVNDARIEYLETKIKKLLEKDENFN